MLRHLMFTFNHLSVFFLTNLLTCVPPNSVSYFSKFWSWSPRPNQNQSIEYLYSCCHLLSVSVSGRRRRRRLFTYIISGLFLEQFFHLCLVVVHSLLMVMRPDVGINEIITRENLESSLLVSWLM